MWTEVSSARSSRKNSAKTTMHQKKFIPTCAFCKQLGKEYKGHMMRNPDGVVVCPQLLNNECRYCHEKGHTPKYCPVLQAKDKRILPNTEETVFKCPPVEEKIWVTAVMENTVNMQTLTPAEETIQSAIEQYKKDTEKEVKKKKARPKLWSQWESDEEYED